MKKLSVKKKTLIVLTSISLMGLLAFGYISFSTYKKDKLAFVYDQIMGQTNSLAQMINLRSEKYEVLLGAVVTQLVDGKLDLMPATKSYLDKEQSFWSLGIKVGAGKETVLSSHQYKMDWKKVTNARLGISSYDLENNLFLHKRPLANGGYAYVLFRDIELSHNLTSNQSHASALVLDGEVLSRSAWKDFDLMVKESKNNLPDFKKVPFGMSELNLRGNSYLVSYASLDGGNYVISFYDVKAVMLVQEVFVKQLLGILALMACISILVGTFAADWLTRCLTKLTEAADKIGEGNFELDLNIHSGDEFEVVGNAFTSMGTKIKNLLLELKRYNTQLELMVAERTRELQELTNIQKTMLNALGQGFVMVDRAKKVSPVYSKVAVDMFDNKPDSVSLLEIMALNEDEKLVMDEFINHVFDENVDFDTFTKIAPAKRSNSHDRKIFLEYAPIRNEENGKMDFMLVIGTDRTEEIESKEKFEREWKFSQMILNMAKNREALCKVISDSFRMLKECETLLTNAPHSYLDIQRRIHTIKGSFSFYYMDKVTQLAHNLESFLEAQIARQTKSHLVNEQLTQLVLAIESSIDEYDEIIKFKQHASGKFISEEDIHHLEALMSPSMKQKFHDIVYSVDIRNEFSSYQKLVHDLGEKLDKKVRFVLTSQSPSYPEGKWMEVIPEFVHVVRNAIDHGIEKAHDRLLAGKNESGEIHFKFKQEDGYMHITLSDDGSGIDVEKLSEKFPGVVDFESAINQIILGGVSSRDEVTEFSGRGVGVSAVIQKTIQLGGSWKIESEKGKGMMIHLLLPLTERKLMLKAS